MTFIARIETEMWRRPSFVVTLSFVTLTQIFFPSARTERCRNFYRVKSGFKRSERKAKAKSTFFHAFIERRRKATNCRSWTSLTLLTWKKVTSSSSQLPLT